MGAEKGIGEIGREKQIKEKEIGSGKGIGKIGREKRIKEKEIGRGNGNRQEKWGERGE